MHRLLRRQMRKHLGVEDGRAVHVEGQLPEAPDGELPHAVDVDPQPGADLDLVRGQGKCHQLQGWVRLVHSGTSSSLARTGGASQSNVW